MNSIHANHRILIGEEAIDIVVASSGPTSRAVRIIYGYSGFHWELPYQEAKDMADSLISMINNDQNQIKISKDIPIMNQSEARELASVLHRVADYISTLDVILD
jgi:hypothetical protein